VFVTRLAPTPSGFLHLGNLYSFLLTAELAQEKNARLLLRIDDMDRKRFRVEYLEDIFRWLDKLSIKLDGGPSSPGDFEKNYRQDLRIAEYRLAMELLKKQNRSYFCVCRRRDYEAKYPATCRSKKWSNTEEGLWRFQAQDLDYALGDFIIWRRDKIPAYQLSSVVDDIKLGINYIVRGEDLLESSQSQMLLWDLLSPTKRPDIDHHSLLLNTEGEKLSKSRVKTSNSLLNDLSVAELKKGYIEWKNSSKLL